MHRRATLSALAAGLLIACQAPEAGEEPTNPPPESELSAMESDSLRLALVLPDSVARGEPLPMTLTVENVGEDPIELYLTGRPIAFDLSVIDAAGEVVWRRLEDQVIAAILRIHRLAPGETLELADVWNQVSNRGDPVPPGDYSVRGELLTDRQPLVTPTRPLRILADG